MRLHTLPMYLRQFRLLDGLRFYVADLLRAILDPNAGIHYAQWGEDAALRFMIDRGPGFYVDVGANHPQRLSNTFELYRRGWRGVTIDANERFRSAHARLRPRDRFVCAVVSDDEREVTFTEFEESLISSIDREWVEKMKTSFGRRVKNERVVHTRTLRGILDEVGAPPRFELLSIDVEGHGHEVLASLDLKRYRPRVVVIEMHDFGMANSSTDPTCAILRDAGYRLAGYLATNAYFLAPETTERTTSDQGTAPGA